MSRVDRADFTSHEPYEDRPQSIGFKATISAPHMHAAALEFLKDHLRGGARVLDVGSGSGYLVACMALMVGTKGVVVGVEHIPQLVELGVKNLKKHHADLLQSGNVTIIEGDGRLGFEKLAPYDAIHVGAAAKGIPKALLEQLAEGGRMMIPVERSEGNQVFLQVDKANGNITEKVVEHVIYVPLTSKEHQLGRE